MSIILYRNRIDHACKQILFLLYSIENETELLGADCLNNNSPYAEIPSQAHEKFIQNCSCF